MKRASNWFEKIYEDIIFDYFNIILFAYIPVYYIYYYTYLYLYILSIHIIYIISSISLLSIELLITTIIYTINLSNISRLLEVWSSNTTLNIKVFRDFKEYPHWAKYCSIISNKSPISALFFQGELLCLS